jgi:hypothetical protein
MGLLVSRILKWKSMKLGLTTVDIVILRSHSLDHDHTPRMAFEEVVNEGNEHDDSSWRGDERKSGEAFDE